MKPAALLILALPVAVHGAEIYRCIEPDGRVTFGDTACPTGEVYRESVQAPWSGWDPYSIMIQNARMLSDYEARLARQRDRPVRTYPGFEDGRAGPGATDPAGSGTGGDGQVERLTCLGLRPGGAGAEPPA